ncbi:MAG: formylglycine-generating enzyme family protein, partial [Candidatus Adiutrix sp.]|nr:formylglycine-generating enzyme family protein [Candidatus Adiutrix sp.]
MRGKFFKILALLACLAGLGPSILSAQADTRDFTDDLVLAGPEGVEFVFRPVSLGEGGGHLASRRFNLGDPSLGFKAWPTTVALGGAFLRPRPGEPQQEEWIYYLGKYEVTEGQYYAVMGPPLGADPKILQSRRPMTNLSYYESQAFLDRLNQWLFSHALEKLPAFNESPGYVRLPTEAEWEFAARGGAAVSSDIFSGKHPYSGKLAAHEWFSGPTSSHNKIQEVGKLAPNPLGLHDMLGNVSEMTTTLYQLEYYQGRSGGLVARGGHFMNKESELNAALRTEAPFYRGDRQKGFKPNKSGTMGLRLAISSAIMTDSAEIDALEDAWDEYAQAARPATPAGASTAPVGIRTDLKAGDARGYLANIKSRLAASGLQAAVLDPLQQELGYVEAAMTDIDVIRKKAEDDSAQSWVRTGTLFSQHYVRELIKRTKLLALMKQYEERRKDGAVLPEIGQRQKDIEANLNEALTAYYETLTQLGTLDQVSVA